MMKPAGDRERLGETRHSMPEYIMGYRRSRKREEKMLWLRRRRQAERLAQADAAALIRDHGAEAYSEARQRERDVILPDGTTHAGRTPAHWRRVALIVARMTGKRVGLDTSTRMAADADLSPNQEIRRPAGARPFLAD